MKLLVAILAVLALVGSAMAWDITDSLKYTYTKNAYQQAGSDLVTPQIDDAKSGAYFVEPSAYGSAIGKVDNQLTGVTMDRVVWQPQADLTRADFYATLTQGGSATLATHSMNGALDPATGLPLNNVPEISGKASAYQNLDVMGGFDQVAANFDSRAIIGTKGTGPTNNWVATQLVQPASGSYMASVDAETHGSGEFMDAYMGASVSADIQQDYKGSGWLEPTYSGGINMWAGFTGGCDPHCANPIISTVSGSAATSLFPGDLAKLQSNVGTGYTTGETAYWGSGWNDAIPNPVTQGLSGSSGTDGMQGVTPIVDDDKPW